MLVLVSVNSMRGLFICNWYVSYLKLFLADMTCIFQVGYLPTIKAIVLKYLENVRLFRYLFFLKKKATYH